MALIYCQSEWFSCQRSVCEWAVRFSHNFTVLLTSLNSFYVWQNVHQCWYSVWRISVAKGRDQLWYLLCKIKEREMFYLMMHSTHFIYGYMASDIWLRTILIVRKETCCSHMGYSFRLTARVLLYAPSHRQDSTYHSLCYNSRGALAGTRNSSMGQQ